MRIIPRPFDICRSHATPRHLSLWHTFPHWQAAIRSDPVCPCSGLTTACHISGLVRLAAAQCYLHAGQNLSRQLNAHKSHSEGISDLVLKHLAGFIVPCLRAKCSVPSSESPKRSAATRMCFVSHACNSQACCATLSPGVSSYRHASCRLQLNGPQACMTCHCLRLTESVILGHFLCSICIPLPASQ